MNEPRVRLDTMQVWREATATIRANKDVLMVLAGVFFFLPTLVIGLFFPQPEPPAGASVEDMMAMARDYYSTAAPYLTLGLVIQIIGQLAVLALTTRGGGLTVAEALRSAMRGTITFIGANLVLFLGAVLATLVVGIVIGALGKGAVAIALMIMLIGMIVWAAVRLSLLAPIIAVEGQRSPVTALRRSWELTRGNALAIMFFIALIILAATVITLVAGSLIGVVVHAIAGAEASEVSSVVITSVAAALVTLVVTVVLAGIHRQVARQDMRQK